MVYNSVITDKITKCESIGKVMAITSDIGSSNQRLWTHWNIAAGKCLYLILLTVIENYLLLLMCHTYSKTIEND